TSVRRNGRHIVAVVLGGSSAGARDARMRELIESNIVDASLRRTAPALVEVAEASEPRPVTRSIAPPSGGMALASASSVPVSLAPTPAAAAAPAPVKVIAARAPPPAAQAASQPAGPNEPPRPIPR